MERAVLQEVGALEDAGDEREDGTPEVAERAVVVSVTSAASEASYWLPLKGITCVRAWRTGRKRSCSGCVNAVAV